MKYIKDRNGDYCILWCIEEKNETTAWNNMCYDGHYKGPFAFQIRKCERCLLNSISKQNWYPLSDAEKASSGKMRNGTFMVLIEDKESYDIHS